MDNDSQNIVEGIDTISKLEVDYEKFSMLLSSSHINFLFGSGVNGESFPQSSGFEQTLEFIRKEVEVPKNCNLEDAIDLISDSEKRNEAKNLFKKEFEKNCNSIDYDSSSINNLKELIKKTYALISKSENRTADMNQIHIFTLNYDYITENIISDLGYSICSIKPSDISLKSSLFNYVSYDYTIKKYVPTYIVSKLHGDINCPILPGKEKYLDTLNENHFELFFMMKSQLIKRNSVLFLIGYSGGDKHINTIINECSDKGLEVYFIDHVKNEDIDSIGIKPSQYLYVNEKPSRSNEDSTKYLSRIFGNALNHDK